MMRTRTLASQLAEVGVAPAQVKFIAFSHTHADHVGNSRLFPTATLYIQQTEHDHDAKQSAGIARTTRRVPVAPLPDWRSTHGVDAPATGGEERVTSRLAGFRADRARSHPDADDRSP